MNKSKLIAFAKKFKFARPLWHFYKACIFKIKNPYRKYNKKKRKGVIIQLVETFIERDAVGNCIIEISKQLSSLKKENYILYGGCHSNIKNGVPVSCFRFNKDDIVIYHMAIGCEMSNIYKKIDVKKKILYYHNITPAKFFPDMPVSQKLCNLGREQLKEMKECTNLALCVSKYNQKELLELGYTNTVVVGIPNRIHELVKLKTEHNNDKTIRLLTVGRIVRNKCIEDVVKVFAEYHKLNTNSILNIVGKIDNNGYNNEIIKLIKDCKLEDYIIFDYSVSEEKLAEYYSNADAYICMSEHEGFCVPLYEACAFRVPVFAYNCCAIGEHPNYLINLFDTKDYQLIAKSIEEKNKKKTLYDNDVELPKFNFDINEWLK